MNIAMSITRRTISIPESLAREVERVARKEKRSFSGALARLAEEALGRRKSPRFKSMGAGRSGLPDLGERAEEYLREIFDDFRD